MRRRGCFWLIARSYDFCYRKFTSFPFRVFLVKCHPRLDQCISYLSEQLFNIYTYFGTCFYELHAQLIRLLHSLVRCHLSLFCVIYFIRYQNDGQVFASDLSRLVNPALAVFEGSFRCDVVAHDRDARIIDVAWY